LSFCPQLLRIIPFIFESFGGKKQYFSIHLAIVPQFTNISRKLLILQNIHGLKACEAAQTFMGMHSSIEMPNNFNPEYELHLEPKSGFSLAGK